MTCGETENYCGRAEKTQTSQARITGYAASLGPQKMRPGPATRAAFVRGFLLKLVTAWRRNDRFSPTALDTIPSAAFAKAGCGSIISRSRIHNRRGWPAALLPLRKAEWGRRPQRPGNQFALARGFWIPPGNSLSRIAGCRWLCRNHSASSGTLTFR
jgi:hypothetical protein